MPKKPKWLRLLIIGALAIVALSACVPRTYGEPSATWGSSEWDEAHYY